MKYIIIVEDYSGRFIGFVHKGYLNRWLTLRRSQATVFQTRRDVNKFYAFLRKKALTGGSDILKYITLRIKQIPRC